ncbi:shikimate kinase [Hoyosella subflava]|uniref:Shikimate kinase n=1 Tax=Hoyosella subflava (strain DSM 45089 / JCM 17490 / NBRC 109087 / DQS3-9A1) TaxID=443218 RepID=F6EMD6_HOYSD|nr:shikimate kinase [Hoyosella subflava]AEF40296.1 Shikimate kinase [Hoyosella subflava DQS3-9A1]
MPPRAILVGPPGAGKSTIGRRLASALGVPFYDTDAAIERETGRSIREIFSTDGEAGFRKIEEDVVGRAIAEQTGIVSLGGGAVLSPVTQQALRGHTVIYLEITVAEGLRRTGANKSRPLLDGDDPGAKYRALMRRRRPIYKKVSTLRVRTNGRSPGRSVQYILRRIGGEQQQPRTRWPVPMRPGRPIRSSQPPRDEHKTEDNR